MATKADPKNLSRPTVKHPSHPHPLRPFKAIEDDELICSGCELDLLGSAYKCTKSDCDYFLHKPCFSLPKQITLKSHLDHSLTLIFLQNELSTFMCDACGEYGTAFRYQCSSCDYDVHIGCSSMPESVERGSHDHPLKLFYSSSACKVNGEAFVCGECKETVDENRWVYYCQDCGYGTHLLLGCDSDGKDEGSKNGGRKKAVDSGEATASTIDGLNSVLEAQQQLAVMNFKTQLGMQQARMVADFGRSFWY